MANFPSSQLTGIPKNRFYAAEPDFDAATDTWEYEDGSKDRNEVSDTFIRRWEYVYDGLTPEQAAQFDTFNQTVRRAYPFTFLDKYDVAWSNVFIESYSRTHEAHKSWIVRVEFNLVGENSQILDPPEVSLTDLDEVSGDIVLTGTVSESSELRLYINNEYHSIQTDNDSFTFTIPLEDLIGGLNSFKVTALNSVGAIATSNVLTYTKDATPPVVSIVSPTSGSIVSGTINITVSATDNVAVDRVEFFYFDGEGYAPFHIDYNSPYSATFDTALVGNGTLELAVTAFDTVGNSSVAAVTVTVGIPPYTITDNLTLRTFDAEDYTPDSLADLLATLIMDLMNDTPIPNYDISNAFTLRTLDAASYSMDELVNLIATVISDLGDGSTVSGYTISNDTTLRTLNAELYTPDGLANVLATLIRDLGGVAPPDVTAPSIPTGLTATMLSDTEIILDDFVSTDAVGVTGYEYRIDGGSAVDIGLTKPFTVSGLTASTEYDFEVRAYDAAGNFSGWSSIVSETTDAGAPSNLFQDNFNRANGAVANGWTQPTGSSWSSVGFTTGDANIVSNQLVLGDAAKHVAILRPDIFLDGYNQVQWISGGYALIARFDSNTFYLASKAGGIVSLFKVSGNAQTLLEAGGVVSVTDTLKLEIEDVAGNAEITVYVNDSPSIEYSDTSPLPTGQWGIMTDYEAGTLENYEQNY